MNGPEHYGTAEALIGQLIDAGSSDEEKRMLAEAQVHATLALAAATALGAVEGWTSSDAHANACEDEARAWFGTLGGDR